MKRILLFVTCSLFFAASALALDFDFSLPKDRGNLLVIDDFRGTIGRGDFSIRDVAKLMETVKQLQDKVKILEDRIKKLEQKK